MMRFARQALLVAWFFSAGSVYNQTRAQIPNDYVRYFAALAWPVFVLAALVKGTGE
jgi:hypothetical protein